MFIDVSTEQARAIIGAMVAVAATNGESSVTNADRASLLGAWHYLLRQPGMLDLAALDKPDAAPFAAVLSSAEVRAQAARMLTVMAFVDGRLDAAKIVTVLGYARALGIEEPYIQEVAAAAHGDIRRALIDMTRRNMESITGKPFLGDDATTWFLPYAGRHADPMLVARYRALGKLPRDSFGFAFHDQYVRNNYAFPGEPAGLNEAFAQPHDSLHVLTGYDTSPRGELLVSTFTAACHPFRPMEGHVLPVIFSWHLGIRINDVAGAATGALDPETFWHAWARGAATRVDVFAPGWDFWNCTPKPLAIVREQLGIPPE